MTSTSQKSYASRLGNAKKMATIVATFTDYQPPVPNASVENLQQTITNIEQIQEEYNTATLSYTLVTNERKKIFSDNEDALEKRLAPIRGFIEALKGKESVELKQVGTVIKKIRGKANPKPVSDTESETTVISQVERTYASRITNFKIIIDLLTSLGEAYTPPNELITVTALNELAIKAAQSTVEVDKALSLLKPIIEARQTNFENLKNQVQTIKNFVKAQYGLTSNEYKQIKGLAV
ncbi:conserved protein of unknown function [Tenacibaculum sp. 190524A02b]|uniref:hypothetical protein n=1 Tax=Tenacibaculum vairaonense TaxID=3137860 RepID=UPI0032B2348C